MAEIFIPQLLPRAPANDLNGLIQGLQAGQAIQQMPQQALLREKLLDLQDPNRAIARQLQGQLALQATNPIQTGVLYDPEAAKAAAVLGPIAQPRTVNVDPTSGAITEVTPNQGSLETIIAGGVPSAFVRNRALPEAEAARLQAIKDANEEFTLTPGAKRFRGNKEIASVPEKGVTIKNTATKEGNEIVIRDSVTQEVVRREPLKPEEKVLDTKNGVFVYIEGSNQAPRLLEGTAPSAAGGGLKAGAEESAKFRGTINTFASLDDLKQRVGQFEKTKKFPGSTQAFISEFVSTKPQDQPWAKWIPGGAAAYATFQSALQNARTPEAIEYESMRAELAAGIIRAQAGLSQTTGEISNVIPYTPQITDTIDSLKIKLRNLDRLAQRDLNTFRNVYPEMRSTKIQGFFPIEDRTFTSEEAANASTLPVGTPIIVNGRAGEITPK